MIAIFTGVNLGTGRGSVNRNLDKQGKRPPGIPGEEENLTAVVGMITQIKLLIHDGVSLW